MTYAFGCFLLFFISLLIEVFVMNLLFHCGVHWVRFLNGGKHVCVCGMCVHV